MPPNLSLDVPDGEHCLGLETVEPLELADVASIVIDVRSHEERADGYITGSMHVPFEDWDRTELTASAEAVLDEAAARRVRVIFHCMYSRERGPTCARLAASWRPGLTVTLLKGGFQAALNQLSDEAPELLHGVVRERWVQGPGQYLVWEPDLHPLGLPPPCTDCDDDEDACTCCTESWPLAARGRQPVADSTRPTARGVRRLLHRTPSTTVVRVDVPSHSSTPSTAVVGVIDFHQHCQADDDAALAELHQANRRFGVRCAVLLALRQPSSDRRDVLRRNAWVLAAARRFRGAFVPFVTILEDDPNAATMLSSAIDQGARGLKLIGWSGAYIKERDYDLCAHNLQAVYRLAASRRLPVLLHCWLGCPHSSRDLCADLDAVLSAHPTLTLVLAHFGLGFDAVTLPRLHELLARHPNLCIDTSLYGGARTKWLARAAARHAPLRAVVEAHPQQVLFGTDVFGDRRHKPTVYDDALRTSYAMVAAEEVRARAGEFAAAPSAFEDDGYGITTFDSNSLHGLNLQASPELLKQVLAGNAVRVLGLSVDADS